VRSAIFHRNGVDDRLPKAMTFPPSEYAQHVTHESLTLVVHDPNGVAGAGRCRCSPAGSAAAGSAVARQRAWLARAEQTAQVLPPARAAGRDLDYVVLDIDGTLIEVHSEKEQASPHFKGGFGMHLILCFLDNTNEALAGVLRTGRAGSNTAADHEARR
jgi:hypothetical protein